MSLEIADFTLTLDFSKSKQDPPEMIKRIMDKAAFQSAFIVEVGGAYPWPDTLEILFPELTTEEGAPTNGIFTQELPSQGTSHPVEEIARDLVFNLDRKSIQIPTLFFIHEEITVALIAGDLYRIALRGTEHEERAQRINERNAMLPIQTPAIEIAKMNANATRYTVRKVEEATGVSRRDAQRHIANMRKEGFLPKELVTPQGKQLQLSADQFARVCTYIMQRNRKRGNPNLSRL